MARGPPGRGGLALRSLPRCLALLALCAMLGHGLPRAAAQGQQSDFIDVGAPWNTRDGDATCILRKTKNHETSRYGARKGLQDLNRQNMVDCEQHGGLRGFWMRSYNDDYFWYEFICCKPRSSESVWATTEASKLRKQYFESKASYSGNDQWYHHNYVLVGWKDNKADAAAELHAARCTNPEISAMKSWQFIEKNEFWQWQGNCVEMELLMPTTTHYGGFKSAGSNGNNDNRHACTIANQCNEVYYLDRHNITCPGESSIITKFVVRDAGWYERTQYDGNFYKYEMRYVWECAKIGKPYPRRSGRYVFVRESSTDACLTTFLGQNKPGIDASQENRVYLQAQCARTEQELFYAQITQSTPEFDKVKLVHTKSGRCLNREDNSPTSDVSLTSCDDPEAEKTYYRAGGTLTAIGGYWLHTPAFPRPAEPTSLWNKVKWEKMQTLARSRWMPEVTEGETIDNFGNLCGPQSLASVGWRQVDDQGRLKCPFQDATGVGRARGDLKLAIPKPFDKLRPLKSLEAIWVKGKPTDGLVGIAAEFKDALKQEILAPDAVGETAAAICNLPDPGYMLKLWILTNRKDVGGKLSELKVLGIKFTNSDGTTCALPPLSVAPDLPWDEATEVAVDSGVPVGIIGRATDRINALGVAFLGTLDTISFFPEYDQKTWIANFLANKKPIVYAGGSLSNNNNLPATLSRQVSYTVAQSTTLSDASSRSTTDTYTWANSVAFKTAWGYKFSFKGSYPMLGDITDEVTINFDKTWTNNWGGSSSDTKGTTLTRQVSNTTTVGVVGTCSTNVNPGKAVSVEMILYEARQSLRYTGVVFYTLKSGANFSYPIEGQMDDVASTNAICRIGPEVSIPATKAAGARAKTAGAAAAAAGAAYKYALPTNTFIRRSPCGKEYRLTGNENGMGLIEFANKCKVSVDCLVRRNQALFGPNSNAVEYSLLGLPRFTKQAGGKIIRIGC